MTKQQDSVSLRDICIASPVVISAPILMSYGLEKFTPLDEGILLKGSAFGFISFLILSLVFYKRLFPFVSVPEYKFVGILGPIAYGAWGAMLLLGLVLVINGVFDQSKAHTFNAHVIKADYFKQRFKVIAHADHWSDDFNYSFTVERDQYRKYQVPTITLTTKEGTLGIDWIEERIP